MLRAARPAPRRASSTSGSDEKRKNLVNLAMAYMGLAAPAPQLPPLVLVGPGLRTGRRAARSRGPQIRATGYLETREIRALMAASAALVLPSLEEGFGLPVVEAMAAGLPVVCSRGSALEEVAGDAATLVEPARHAVHRRRHRAVLDDPERPRTQRRLGLERSRAVRLGHGGRAHARLLPPVCVVSRSTAHRDRVADRDRRPRARRAGPPAPAATSATCCAPGAGGATTRWSSYFNGPAPARPRPRPRPASSAAPSGDGAHARRRLAGAPLPQAAAPDALDVFFAPAYTCPLVSGRPAGHRRARPVVLLVARRLQLPDAARRRLLVAASIGASRPVIACSDFTRREILGSFPDARGARATSPRRRRRPPPSPSREAARASALGRTARRRSSVGAILNRRRLPVLLAPWRLLRRRHPSSAPRGRGREPAPIPGSDFDALVSSLGLEAPRPSLRLRRATLASRTLRRGRRRRLSLRIRGLRPARARGHGARRAGGGERPPRHRRDLRGRRAPRGPERRLAVAARSTACSPSPTARPTSWRGDAPWPGACTWAEAAAAHAGRPRRSGPMTAMLPRTRPTSRASRP